MFPHMIQGHQHQQESRLVYADLDVASERYETKKPVVEDPATLSRDVEYSLIDYSLNVCYEDTQLEGQPKRGVYASCSNNSTISAFTPLHAREFLDHTCNKNCNLIGY